MVFTGTVAMTKVMFTDGATRPIQLNSAVLSLTLATPSRSSRGIVGAISDSVVPSLGATLKTWFAATRLPPPGMLRGITVGLPGMCRPIWRATARA